MKQFLIIGLLILSVTLMFGCTEIFGGGTTIIKTGDGNIDTTHLLHTTDSNLNLPTLTGNSGKFLSAVGGALDWVTVSISGGIGNIWNQDLNTYNNVDFNNLHVDHNIDTNCLSLSDHNQFCTRAALTGPQGIQGFIGPMGPQGPPGDNNINGSGSQNQVTFWTDTNTISGSPKLIFGTQADNVGKYLMIDGKFASSTMGMRPNYEFEASKVSSDYVRFGSPPNDVQLVAGEAGAGDSHKVSIYAYGDGDTIPDTQIILGNGMITGYNDLNLIDNNISAGCLILGDKNIFCGKKDMGSNFIDTNWQTSFGIFDLNMRATYALKGSDTNWQTSFGIFDANMRATYALRTDVNLWAGQLDRQMQIDSNKWSLTKLDANALYALKNDVNTWTNQLLVPYLFKTDANGFFALKSDVNTWIGQRDTNWQNTWSVFDSNMINTYRKYTIDLNTSKNINADGNISAVYFKGNGSLLTGIISGGVDTNTQTANWTTSIGNWLINLVPNVTATYNLGSDPLRWLTGFFVDLNVSNSVKVGGDVNATHLYQGANFVCDSSGNCPTSGIGITDLNYATLMTKISGNTLVAGSYYRITDFATKHFIVDFSETLDASGTQYTTGDGIITGATEPLIVFAVDVNRIDKQAYSPEYPQDIIYYDSNSSNWITNKSFYDIANAHIITGFKGVITYREDTLLNNSTFYDFRNAKNRRWKTSTPTYSDGTTYNQGDFVNNGSIIYRSLTGSNTGNSLTDETYWLPLLDIAGTEYWNNNPTASNGINSDSSYVDVLTFVDGTGTGTYNQSVRNTHIGKSSTDTLIPDNVFWLQDNYYTKNIDIGVDSYGNTVGGLDSGMTGFSCGVGFHANEFTGFIAYNKAGDTFEYNVITDTFGNNNIGDAFVGNYVGTNCVNNDIKANFSYNILKSSFQYNTTQPNLSNIDFSSATYVYANYNKTLQPDSLGAPRLSYIDGTTGLLVIVSATS